MSTSRPTAEVLRYSAFAEEPDGGNPAGVVLEAGGLDDRQMRAIAADVGYSETAFLFPADARGVRTIRYFSPLAEVPFCGHATIAAAGAHAERFGAGELLLASAAGLVGVRTSRGPSGTVATLTSVQPSTAAITTPVRRQLLQALGLIEPDLDPALPLEVAYAGAQHPIVGLAARTRLAELDYDFDALAALMGRQAWATVAVVHRAGPAMFHARNPFPPGGIVEDPATGSAAAALGGYLRRHRLVDPPATVTIRQGEDMGRPSVLTVDIPIDGGIQVSGQVRALD